MTAPAPPAVPAAAPSAAVRPPRRTRPRIGITAATVSVLLHVLVFAFVRFQFVFQPRPVRPVLRAYPVQPAMQAYHIQPVVVEPGQAEPVLPPPRLILPEAPLPAPAVAVPPSAPAVPGRAPTLTERLGRTPTADLELWRPVAPGDYQPELSDEERLRLRLMARMNAYNDSVAAAGLAAERATDWTVTDENGGKWGVTPGKVHLGGITLPLPVNFSPPPGRREEVAARTRNWSETRAQASRAEADDNFKERVKAIRERRQAERDSARTDGR